MAQYGHNYYGTALYGDTNAVYGLYTSEKIDAMEVLKEDMSSLVIVDLPKATYYATDVEFTYTDTWTTSGTEKTSTSGTATFKGSLKSFTVTFAGAGTYTIKKRVGAADWTTFETGTLSGTTLIKTGLEYAMYEIILTADAAGLTVKNINGQICDINLYVRTATTLAGLDAGSYTKATLGSQVAAVPEDVADLIYNEAKVITATTYKMIFNWTGLISAVAPKQYYQFKLEMISSDNDIAPIVKTMVLSCGDTSLYDTDGGTWVGIFDFGAADTIAFKDLEWTAITPAKTTYEIRSSSSADNANWGLWSNPYVLDQTQVRLAAGQRQGYILTQVISPRHLKKWLTLVSDYHDKDTNASAVLPLSFDFFYKPPTGADILLVSNIRPNDINGNLATALRYNGIAVPVYAKIWLRRNTTVENTPSINKFTIKSQCEYIQTKTNISGTISRVYGPKKLTDIVALNFTDRPEDSFGPLNYTIIPHSNKRIELYWLSETNSRFRDSKVSVLISDTVNDSVYAISKEKYYYNYATSEVYFDGEPTIKLVGMTNSFRDIAGNGLNTSLKYQYKIFNKWVGGDSLVVMKNPNTNVEYSSPSAAMEWEHYVDGAHKDVTSFSEINGSTVNGELRNDNVKMTITWGDTIDIVPWISEVKMYDAVVNPNGLQIPYDNDRVLLPEIDQYAFVDPGCYKFEVMPGTIKRNGIPVPTQEFTVSSNIIYAGDSLLYVKDPADSTKTIPNILYIVEDKVTHLTADGVDRLRYNYTFTSNGTEYNAIASLLGVWDTQGNPLRNPVLADYIKDMDYTFDADSSTIDWALNGYEPEVGAEYWVYYLCRKPLYASVEISCDYKEQKIIKNGVWVSQTKQHRTGVCSPGVDYKSPDLAALYPKTETATWGEIPSNVRDITYTVIDNNIWVETTVEENGAEVYVKGSLGRRNPQKNWYPKINSGFYYVGKEEYYNYITPRTVTVDGNTIEYASNVSYKESPFGDTTVKGAVLVEDGTTNLLVNSNFKTKSEQLAYICRFSDLTTIAQGTSKPIEWPTE